MSVLPSMEHRATDVPNPEGQNYLSIRAGGGATDGPLWTAVLVVIGAITGIVVRNHRHASRVLSGDAPTKEG